MWYYNYNRHSFSTVKKVLKKIEKAFYDNEKKEIAERLSWVEQILTNEKKYST
jgi:ribosomal protein S20